MMPICGYPLDDQTDDAQPEPGAWQPRRVALKAAAPAGRQCQRQVKAEGELCYQHRD